MKKIALALALVGLKIYGATFKAAVAKLEDVLIALHISDYDSMDWGAATNCDGTIRSISSICM